MDFKNTLTAYNEHVAQIEEAKKIMMNAPAEVFGKYYHEAMASHPARWP